MKIRKRTAADAAVFVTAVHDAQRREGLWLAEHRFVLAMQEGAVPREALARWVRQLYCIARAYGRSLLALDGPPLIGQYFDPWRDLQLLSELGHALEISGREMKASEPGAVARGIEIWMRAHLADPARHIAGQICWAMVEAMGPELGARMAEGAQFNLGLRAREVRYLRTGMLCRRRAARYAAAILPQIPRAEWPAIEARTLLLSRRMTELYDSVAGNMGVESEIVRAACAPRQPYPVSLFGGLGS